MFGTTLGLAAADPAEALRAKSAPSPPALTHTLAPSPPGSLSQPPLPIHLRPEAEIW